MRSENFFKENKQFLGFFFLLLEILLINILAKKFHFYAHCGSSDCELIFWHTKQFQMIVLNVLE